MGEALLALSPGRVGFLQQTGQQILQTLRLQELVLKGGDNRFVDIGHAIIGKAARIGSHRSPRLTSQIAIASALAGNQNKTRTAVRLSALADGREQRGTVNTSRWGHLGLVHRKPALGGIERVLVDNDRHPGFDPLFARSEDTGL
ncbi:MAG: hypothetical protein KGQ52_11460 [Alphaproteobacteria bacterium]|nr:hypothetical protein [Sandarakinorhabdus cyanobacteriorum]MBU6166729.1 hypothetical protein [Alphaproteobacteria bacterium]